MNPPSHTKQPLRFVMNYVECDLADDLTLPQRRRDRAVAQRRRRYVSLRFITATRHEAA